MTRPFGFALTSRSSRLSPMSFVPLILLTPIYPSRSPCAVDDPADPPESLLSGEISEREFQGDTDGSLVASYRTRVTRALPA
eukprot:228077-Amorphochlora_amoeboformis.AAC.1